MKRTILVWLVVGGSAGMGCLRGSPVETCVAGGGGVAELRCVDRNFEVAYRTDYSGLWSILNQRAPGLKACSDPQEVAAFLPLVRYYGNAEFAEFYSETLEELAVTHALCLAEQVSVAEPKVRDSVVERLRSPLFRTPEEVRGAALQRGVASRFPSFVDAISAPSR
jgi:hypothetical protein